MTKKDFALLFSIVLFLLLFLIFPDFYVLYKTLNADHGILMSALKFALLATLGEAIALRIRKGVYTEKGFGLLPRALVWAFLGVTIKVAMLIFAVGTPIMLAYCGIKSAPAAMQGPLTGLKVLTAFCISVSMNTFFAPVFMTFHKITDTHIIQTGGTLKGLFSPLKIGDILASIDWRRQWAFVFKITIPLFWFPAHTVTFLLPESAQALFAALLSVALGIMLSFAGKSKK